MSTITTYSKVAASAVAVLLISIGASAQPQQMIVSANSNGKPIREAVQSVLSRLRLEAHHTDAAADAMREPSKTFQTRAALATNPSFTVLHSFSGADGTNPWAALMQVSDGSFYGTAESGGLGFGTVFKMDASGNVTTLHSFSYPEGNGPDAALIQARDGSFYGTASDGGSGLGTIFKINTSGSLTVLHSFSGGDGAGPIAPLIQASDGYFYGTTAFGGDLACSVPNTSVAGCGTVFRIDSAGNVTLLHSFSGTDGALPVAALLQSSDGSFYGATLGTLSGGAIAGFGTVFRIDASGQFSVLHSFSGVGAESGVGDPEAPLIQASDGYFYGTTAGSNGAVFRMDASGNITVLHVFSGAGDGPWVPALLQASDGNFYGVTQGGGKQSCVGPPQGCGTFFKMDSSGDVTVLHTFTGPATDGAQPRAPLIEDQTGNLLGTTELGGSQNAGTVFELSGFLAPPLTVTTTSTLPLATIGAPYSFALTATGGNPPYTWSVSSGSLPQGLQLSSAGSITGTPTVAGTSTFTLTVRDSVFAFASATVSITIAAPAVPPPVLSISKTHSGSFTQGQSGAIYTVVVNNASSAGPTSGTVTMTDNLPLGLTLVSMIGKGWNCSGNSCTNGVVLNPGSSYSPITITANVASNAPSQITNQAVVSGGGSASASASDVATLTAPSSSSASGQPTVLSAASYQPVIAPGSLATVLGRNLATQTVGASPASDGTYPKQVGGVTVTVGGAAADILYVSPTQVNFVVPLNAQYGVLSVVVTTGAQTTATAAAMVSPTAPAIFTMDGSGQGFGAIFNGLDFSKPPFTLTTQSGGAQANTILAVYATGVRFAGGTAVSNTSGDVSSHITVLASNPSGRTWALPVLYAGPAPGYEGVDQVNIQLTPDLDTTSDLMLTILADAAPSNAVFLWLQHSPVPNLTAVSSVSASPGAVITISGTGLLDSTNFQALERESVVMVLSDGTRIPAPITNLQAESSSITVPVYVASSNATYYYGTAQICVSVDSQVSCLPGQFAITPPSPTGQPVGTLLMAFAQNIVTQSLAAIPPNTDPTVVAAITATAQQNLDSLQQVITAAISGQPQTIQMPGLTGNNVSVVIDLPAIQRTENIMTAGSFPNPSSSGGTLGSATAAFERLRRIGAIHRRDFTSEIVPDENGLEAAQEKVTALNDAEQAISTAGLYSFLVAAAGGCAGGIAVLPEGTLASCLEGAAQVTGLLAGFETILSVADYATLGTLAVVETQPIFLESLQVSPSTLTLSPLASTGQFQAWGTVVPRTSGISDLVNAIASDAAASLVSKFFGGGGCGTTCSKIPQDVFSGFEQSVGSYLASLIGQHMLSNQSEFGIQDLTISSAQTIQLGPATLSTYAVPEQQAPFSISSVPGQDAWTVMLDASSTLTTGAVSVRADKGNVLLLNETIPTAHLGIALNNAIPAISSDKSSYSVTDAATITGNNFAPGIVISLLLQGNTSTAVLVNSLVPSSSGSFGQIVNFPATAAPGSYRIVAAASDGSQLASVGMMIVSSLAARFTMLSAGQNVSNGGVMNLGVAQGSNPTISLDGSASGPGPILTWLWLDNGTAISCTSPTCSYTPSPSLPNHTLTLTVTNSLSQTSTATGQVNITVQSSAPGPFTLTAEVPVCDATAHSPAVRLDWTLSADASNYDIYRNGSLYSPAGVNLSGTTFYNSAGVAAGQGYTYFIRAKNSVGTADSNTVNVSVPTNICQAQAPAPSLSGLSPSSYPANNNNQTMLLNGANFQSGATLTFHDPQGNAYAGRATSFVSSSQLSSTFNNGSDPGTWTLFVTNPDSQSSNTLSFTVTATAAAPSISGLSPSSYPANSSNQSMLINGANFQSGATLTFHDPQGNAYAGRAATFVSGSQLSATFNNGNDPGTWTVFASNPDSQNSNTWSFTVTGSTQAPAVNTGSASGITANSATLAGTVNPNGLSTQIWFLYGTNSSLSGASQTPSQNVGSGTNSVPVNANVSSLSPNTTYYYQLQAQNGTGTSSGAILSFATTSSGGGLTISSVSISPSSLATGGFATLSVTINGLAPAGGANVTIQTSNATAFPAPSTISIPAGQSSNGVSVQAGTVSSSTIVTVTAMYGGSSRSMTVTVTPSGTNLVSVTPGVWQPQFTVGGAPATFGFQITSQNSTALNGTITAATNSGGAWLTVNGLASYSWTAPETVNATASPNGLSAGTYTGTLTVTAPAASNSPVSIPVTMTILTPLQIITTSLPTATWGQTYSFQLQASGGSGFVWSLQSGNLPAGLTLSSSGLISGTLPNANSMTSSTFTVGVTNSAGQIASKQFTLTVQAPIVVSTNAPSSFQFSVGMAYVEPPNGNNSMSFFANGGTAPYKWSATGLPPGLTLDSTSGFLVGTPSQPGAFPAIVTATDASGRTGSGTFNLAVVTSPLLITTATGLTPPTLPSGTVSAVYSQFLDATGGSNSGYQWTVTGFPPGITGQVNPSACTSCSYMIAGTPTQAGNYTLSVRVTDSLGNTASANVTLVINSGTPPTITTNTLTLATVGQSYNFLFAATGGTPPYQWSFNGPSPDPDLQLTSSGALQGTSSVPNDCPTGPAIWIGNAPPFGTFASAYFQVRVTDSLGQSTNKQFCLPAYYPTPQITSLSPPSVTADGQTHTVTVNGSNFRNDDQIYNTGNGFANLISPSALSFTLSPAPPSCTNLNSSYVFLLSTGACWAKGTYQLWIVQPYSNISNQVNFTVN